MGSRQAFPHCSASLRADSSGSSTSAWRPHLAMSQGRGHCSVPLTLSPGPGLTACADTDSDPAWSKRPCKHSLRYAEPSHVLLGSSAPSMTSPASGPEKSVVCSPWQGAGRNGGCCCGVHTWEPGRAFVTLTPSLLFPSASLAG